MSLSGMGRRRTTHRGFWSCAFVMLLCSLGFLKLPLRTHTTCRPAYLTRSFSGQVKVSPVSGSAEQLTLDNVNRMGDLMVIHLMEIRKAKKRTGNRSCKHPAFSFLLGKPKRHHALTLRRRRLSPNFCVRGKLSFMVSLCIGQNAHLPRILRRSHGTP